ncbi:MAG TPA: hypothetical protein VKS20_08450 [Candidatus Acidoferrales bacterium]|nr:hypothetical protein [Candidatus Acidoferrales bacterium]
MKRFAVCTAEERCRPPRHIAASDASAQAFVVLPIRQLYAVLHGSVRIKNYEFEVPEIDVTQRSIRRLY